MGWGRGRGSRTSFVATFTTPASSVPGAPAIPVTPPSARKCACGCSSSPGPGCMARGFRQMRTGRIHTATGWCSTPAAAPAGGCTHSPRPVSRPSGSWESTCWRSASPRRAGASRGLTCRWSESKRRTRRRRHPHASRLRLRACCKATCGICPCPTAAARSSCSSPSYPPWAGDTRSTGRSPRCGACSPPAAPSSSGSLVSLAPTPTRASSACASCATGSAAR